MRGLPEALLAKAFPCHPQEFSPPPNKYENFNSAAFGIYQAQNVIAVTCIFSYVKLLRFLQLSPRLSQLTLTLSEAASDIGAFMIIFLVVFLAYAQAFTMAFGMEVDAFQSFPTSVTTLFLVILGEFDFQALLDANPVLAPVLFFTFVIFVFFVLVNMFIAILSEAHEVVASRVNEETDEFIVQMREGWQRRVRSLSKKKYQGSESVEELAKSLEKEQDSVPIDGGDGSLLSGLSNTMGHWWDSHTKPVALKKSSVGGILERASGTALLSALQRKERSDGPNGENGEDEDDFEDSAPHEDGAAGLRIRETDALTSRVERMEREQVQTTEWVRRSHNQLVEKLGLLQEATFSITNMVSGVGVHWQPGSAGGPADAAVEERGASPESARSSELLQRASGAERALKSALGSARR